MVAKKKIKEVQRGERGEGHREAQARTEALSRQQSAKVRTLVKGWVYVRHSSFSLDKSEQNTI
jgi:hypothetical protein